MLAASLPNPNLFLTTSQRIKAVNAPASAFLYAIDRCQLDEEPHEPNMDLIAEIEALLLTGDGGAR